MRLKISRRKFIELTAGVAAAQAVRPLAGAATGDARRAMTTVKLLPTASPIAEPYLQLHGGAFDGPAVLQSPDPLVRYRWKEPQAADDLQVYALGPVRSETATPASFRNLMESGAAGNVIRVEGTGSIRFDFGVESAAWLEFDSEDISGAVEMSISEYDEPAVENTGPEHPVKTLAPKRYGNTFRLELNRELYEGVRFGWVHVREFVKPWHITAVRAVCQVKPTNYNGRFDCSDEQLTRIWYTGAYSVKVNFYKDYFGAILMDRGDRYSWTGDAHPAQAAALAAFGDWDFVKLNLERTAADSNGIASYAMYWVLSLMDYYRHSGDVETLRKYVEQATKILQHGESIYADPRINFYGWDERLGAGFENPEIFETKSAYRMLFVRCCGEFAEGMDGIGRSDLGDAYRKIAAEKLKELRTSDRWFQPFGMHALADTVNTGMLTAKEESAIYAQEFSDRLGCLSYSPFNQYFILQAMTRMGRMDEALLSVQDMWGGEIEYGGTTFFEVYAPSWNRAVGKNGAVPNCQVGYTSLAHAWGAGVTAWLSHEVLGIKPTAPGFAKVEIAPQLGRTLRWVSGSVPTPHGAVTVHFDSRNGEGAVSIPANCVGRIGVPRMEREIRSVTMNGRVVWDGEFHDVAGVGGATAGKDYLYLEDVVAGEYAYSVLYRGETSAFVPRPLVYPMQSVRQDAVTSGNWGGVYGRDGHVLFDYDGVGKDRWEFSAKVVAVTPSTNRNGICLHAQRAAGTMDHGAPAPDGSTVHAKNAVRNVGELRTGAPAAGNETMFIDVEVVEDWKYQLALYFVDWDRQGRRQAIAVFDLKNMNRIAPVQVVQEFGQGKYLVYACDRSVRLRVDQIRGENAVLNAVFFDGVGR